MEINKSKSQRYAKFREYARQPKSEETKKRMSEAKKGVPKSEQHRQRMRETHLRRDKVYKEIMRETGLTYQQAKKEWTRRRNNMIRDLMKKTGNSKQYCEDFLKKKGVL